MAFVCANQSDPKEGYFNIFKKDNERHFRLKYKQNDTVSEISINNATGYSGIISTIKYFCCVVGLSITSGNVSLDLDSIVDEDIFNGNATMVSIKCKNFGSVYCKKLTSTGVGVLRHFVNDKKYSIFANMYGFINLVNTAHLDDKYKYGLILEKCYPIKDPELITMDKIALGIKSLCEYYDDSDGCIHGDASPQNIMHDKFGNLKLVDPVNLVDGYVEYINTEFYGSRTIFEELRAFVYSCFMIYARLNNVDVNMLRIYYNNSFNKPEISVDMGIPIQTFLSDIRTTFTFDEFIDYSKTKCLEYFTEFAPILSDEEGDDEIELDSDLVDPTNINDEYDSD
jgi:hypothetical protein